MSGTTGPARGAPAAAVPAQSPIVESLGAFLEVLRRRNILWTLQLGTVSNANTVDNLILSAIVPVTLDGDANSVNAQSLVGFVWGGSRVVVIFVPPTGYYVIAYVGEPPVLEGQRLHVTGQADVTLTSQGNPVQIGLTGVGNVVMDTNELQARNNGAAASYFINASGGNVGLGSAASAVSTAGTWAAGNETYGNTSIVPVANTPTSTTVSYSALTGASGTFVGVGSAQTSGIGTVVLGATVSSVASTSTIVWVTRTNTAATTVSWIVKQKP